MTNTEEQLILAGVGALVIYLVYKRVLAAPLDAAQTAAQEATKNAGSITLDDAQKCADAMRRCDQVSAAYYCPWTFGGAYFNWLSTGCGGTTAPLPDGAPL